MSLTTLIIEWSSHSLAPCFFGIAVDIGLRKVVTFIYFIYYFSNHIGSLIQSHLIILVCFSSFPPVSILHQILILHPLPYLPVLWLSRLCCQSMIIWCKITEISLPLLDIMHHQRTSHSVCFLSLHTSLWVIHFFALFAFLLMFLLNIVSTVSLLGIVFCFYIINSDLISSFIHFFKSLFL